MESQKHKNLSITLLLLLGVGLAIPWPKRKEDILPGASLDSVFAFVSEANGESIYKGPGSGLIDRLSNNTYVGQITGDRNGEYIEIVTGIDDFANFFWIAETAINQVVGSANAYELLKNGASEKSNSTLNKINEANA
jgi:hypothetical protein